MADFDVKGLDASTWPDFAALVERHNGVWGGCWCMAFHAEGIGHGTDGSAEQIVEGAAGSRGRAHAALVYDTGVCVGRCQFGPVNELPRVRVARAKTARLPDWRITCFFIDQRRGRQVASAALEATAEIARLGGGLVESCIAELPDAKLASGFGFNANVAMFERMALRANGSLP